MRTANKRMLTLKEQAVIEGKLKGMNNTQIGLKVYNTTSQSNASMMVGRVLKKPTVQNEIESRLTAQNIFVDAHLKNIDKLAFSAKGEDVRLRASQDLADRAGAHYKYYADDGKVSLDVELSDEQFNTIIRKYATEQTN